MKSKFVWLLISCLAVAALLLASCQPKPTEPTTPEAEMVRDSLGRLVEKPKYGGTFTLAVIASPKRFDPAVSYGASWTIKFTHDNPLSGDWAKGPSGTGEASWRYGITPSVSTLRGCFAENWEMPDAETIVYHIRKGVHFHDKPPTNGREADANDMVWSLRRLWQHGAYYTTAYPAETHLKGTLEEAIYAPDKWTVVVKCQPGRSGAVFERTAIYSSQPSILPHEVADEYGDFMDWKNACGTGPFMLTDFVPDSAVIYVKNPNYWQKHPLYPQDTMPYLDGIKMLIIPDASTRLSALRTGKIDWLGGSDLNEGALGWEDANTLMQTSPELKYKESLGGMAIGGISFRLDKEELPFADIRVRKALSMALDREEIINTILGSRGEPLTYPVSNFAEYADIFVPLEKLPESIREIYEYHPNKAKQLLAEAGYPDGFSTTITCIADDVDVQAVVKEYWAKIDVEMELDVKEYGVYQSMVTSKKTYPELAAKPSGGGQIPFRFMSETPGGMYNWSLVDDPRLTEAQVACEAAYWDETKKRQAFKDVHMYMLEQVYYINLPAEYQYFFWQPWVKGYNGEWTVGYYGNYNFPIWTWIDQDLKEERIGIR